MCTTQHSTAHENFDIFFPPKKRLNDIDAYNEFMFFSFPFFLSLSSFPDLCFSSIPPLSSVALRFASLLFLVIFFLSFLFASDFHILGVSSLAKRRQCSYILPHTYSVCH